MKVTTEELDDIRPYHRNPRVNDRTIKELKKAIREYGFKVPIVVDGGGTIGTGHARYKACLELRGELDDRIEELRGQGRDKLADNLEVINDGKIYVIPGDDLTEEQIKRFRIVDNKIQEYTEWDRQELKFELREIDDQVIGFEEEELEMITEPGDTLNIAEGDVGEAEGKVDEKYTGQSEKEHERKIEIRCPHCQEKIFLDVDQIKRNYNM